MSTAKAAQPEKLGFDLFHFVNLSGEEGRQWVDQYETSGCADLKQQIQGCLYLLHAGEAEKAREILERVGRELDSKDVEPSIIHVIGRWYHGIWAYYYYVVGDLDTAETELYEGLEAIRAGIDDYDFLTSLASHCMDLEIQAARVERRRRRWRRMREHLECSRAMVFGEKPFCVLSDGTPILLSTLSDHFEALPLGEEEKEAVSAFFDDAAKGDTFDKHLRQMYSLPGLVVNYP